MVGILAREESEMGSYTDTLNRLFPWGCETESEVIAELVRRVIASEDDMEKLRGAVISDAVRLNAHAEDITELTRRIDELGIRLGAHEGVVFAELSRRTEELAEQVARHRQDREGDWARVAVRVAMLAERIEKLAERVEGLAPAADTEFLAERLLSLKRRIEKLEERED